MAYRLAKPFNMHTKRKPLKMRGFQRERDLYSEEDVSRICLGKNSLQIQNNNVISNVNREENLTAARLSTILAPGRLGIDPSGTLERSLLSGKCWKQAKRRTLAI